MTLSRHETRGTIECPSPKRHLPGCRGHVLLWLCWFSAIVKGYEAKRGSHATWYAKTMRVRVTNYATSPPTSALQDGSVAGTCKSRAPLRFWAQLLVMCAICPTTRSNSHSLWARRQLPTHHESQMLGKPPLCRYSCTTTEHLACRVQRISFIMTDLVLETRDSSRIHTKGCARRQLTHACCQPDSRKEVGLTPASDDSGLPGFCLE